MKSCRYSLAIFVLIALASSGLGQQTTTPAPADVPRLVNFSGRATDAKGDVVSGIMGITLSIYKEQYDGAPLWSETQNVTADAKGNYMVQLGATKSDGLPLELFSTGDARWLGVRINGDEEQPRVLLLSVPYALKAADAQTLGGLPASAFALALQPSASSSTPVQTSVKAKSASTASVGGTGTAEYIPLWTSSTALGNSALYQVDTKVGVNTKTPATALDVTGKVNASGGFNLGGQPFAFGSLANGNAFLGFAGNATTNSSKLGNTAIGVNALHSNTTGLNNTAIGDDALRYNTTGNQNTAVGVETLIVNTSGGANTAVGFNVLSGNTTGSQNTAIGGAALGNNSTGTDNTATGYSALESNGTGTQNTGTGSGALSSNTTGIANTASGYDALVANTTGGGNTASGFQALYSNTTGRSNTATGLYALYRNTTGLVNTATGVGALFYNTTGGNNTADGSNALGENRTGSQNTATGNYALGFLGANTTDSSNTADGAEAFFSLETGSENTAVGFQAAYSVASGTALTCIGYDCSINANGLSNATAIGAFAVVGQSNSLVLGGAGVKVGVGTPTPSNVFTVGKGAGHAISDSWDTYSSRRWKTNIQTLPDALAKVEHLRGVSYDLKDSGKHEIGVIAEEVGHVVPEIVSYEANGKDARGVDYSRLTALLIEAIKQQQKQISTQQKQIATQQSHTRQQQRLMQREVARLNRKIGVLEASLREDKAKQPITVALK
jgi:Chaperone of endosialidase